MLNKKVVPFVLFFIIANPMTFMLTSRIPVVGRYITDSSGRPTQIGVLIHALVYTLVCHAVWMAVYKN
jgi:hypothetical protein